MDQVFKSKIESELKSKISNIEMISGGDYGFSYKLSLNNNKDYFFKYLEIPSPSANIKSEINNLESLAKSNSCQTPDVIGYIEIKSSKSGLLLEWIDRKIPSISNLESFGRKLAQLHLNKAESFGWFEDNFISILNQSNNHNSSWSSFYLQERIEPLLKQAIEQQIIPSNYHRSLVTLEKRLINEIPHESASLLHGDLWSGNFIIAKKNEAYLIDPSCYYGHREMDLAMSLLFGSFGRPFYTAYQEIYPLEPGFESRLDLHQLYPLLVHALLFKGLYINKVLEILKR